MPRIARTICDTARTGAVAFLLACSLPAPASAQDPVHEHFSFQFQAPGNTLQSAFALLDSVVAGNVIGDIGGAHRSVIEGSFNGFSGISLFNQHAGSASNQGNVLAIALGAQTSGFGLQEAMAAGGSVLANNSLTVQGGERHNTITDSFNNSAGILLVNQASGNLNIERNALAIALGFGATQGAVLESDATLATHRSNNTLVTDNATNMSNSISNAFDGFRGIAVVNQVAGDMNVLSSSVAISVSVINLP